MTDAIAIRPVDDHAYIAKHFDIAPPYERRQCAESVCLVADAGDRDSPLGYIEVVIYNNAEEERSGSCHPDQNAWIHYVESKHPGIGRRLVEAARAWLVTRTSLIQRKNVYVARCNGVGGFWLKCGFVDLFDDLAEPHDVTVFAAAGDDVDCALDRVRIHIAADGSVTGYESELGLTYRPERLAEHTDCGTLMGMPLIGTEFDREKPLEPV